MYVHVTATYCCMTKHQNSPHRGGNPWKRKCSQFNSAQISQYYSKNMRTIQLNLKECQVWVKNQANIPLSIQTGGLPVGLLLQKTFLQILGCYIMNFMVSPWAWFLLNVKFQNISPGICWSHSSSLGIADPSVPVTMWNTVVFIPHSLSSCSLRLWYLSRCAPGSCWNDGITTYISLHPSSLCPTWHVQLVRHQLFISAKYLKVPQDLSLVILQHRWRWWISQKLWTDYPDIQKMLAQLPLFHPANLSKPENQIRGAVNNRPMS